MILMSNINDYREDHRFLDLENKLADLTRQMGPLWEELNKEFPLEDYCHYFLNGNYRLSFTYDRSPDEQ